MPNNNLKSLLDEVNSSATLDDAWKAMLSAPTDFLSGQASDLGSASIAVGATFRFAELDPVGQVSLSSALRWAAKVALNSSADQDPTTRYQIQQTREKVGDWLRSLPWPLRKKLTMEVVEMAMVAVSQENWKQGCWLLASVGWRTSQIENFLWNKSTQEGEDARGDLKFAVLVELGVPAEKRREYLSEAHRRYAIRKNRHNLNAIYSLADPSSFEILAEPPTGAATEDDKYAWLFLPQTIARIADKQNVEKVASKAADLLRILFKNHRETMERGIYLGGAVIPKCNSRKAVRFLLQLIANEAQENSEHDLMLLTRRLEECVGSNQIRALNLSRNRAPLKKLFKKILSRPNDDKGRALTFEADVKNHLWNLCLSLGTDSATKIGYAFIEADENPYIRFNILSDLSCFALDPLPERIKSWASRSGPSHEDTLGADEIQSMESIRVVASAGTMEAFSVLLNSQYLSSTGHTLADSATGLSYVAVKLAKDKNIREDIVRDLLRTLTVGPRGPQPGAVTTALMDLANVGALTEVDYGTIIEFLLRKPEPEWLEAPIIKSRLIASLSSAPSQLLTDELVDKIKAWGEGPDRMLATSCFETLIKQGLVPDRTNSLPQQIDFKRGESKPNLQPRDQKEVNGGIYAMLANRYPNRFESDFAQFLQNCAFGSLVEAMETLRRLRINDESGVVFRPKWGEALVRRAISNNTRYSSESYIFELLTMYAPVQLVSTSWAQHLVSWTPETREALATALGAVTGNRTFWREVRESLLILQNDTHYGVRRAAFRSLGIIDPSFLGAMVKSLSTSEAPDIRKVAAEALFWIPPRFRKRADWSIAKMKLEEDPADDVRDAMWKAEQRDRKVQWARKYLAKLVAPAIESEVLNRWKFAEAISHVGDDQTAFSLRAHLRSKSLAAHVQRFFIRTIERLEKNWEKCRSKWPEPLAPGTARTTRGVGYITAFGERFDVQYLSWQRPEILEPNVLSWGGKGVAAKPLSQSLLEGKVNFTNEQGQTYAIWVYSLNMPFGFSFSGGDLQGSS